MGKSVKLAPPVRPRGNRSEELMKKAEKLGLIAVVVAIAGFPLSVMGIGFFLGIVGIVLAIRARRTSSHKPINAIIAIVFGVLDLIIGIPGLIMFYGVVIHPGSPAVQKLVDFIVDALNLACIFG